MGNDRSQTPRNTIDKPVSMLALVPKSGAITRVARQAYTVMLYLAREQEEQNKSAMEVYKVPLSDVVIGFEGSKESWKELKTHLRSMVSHIVEWGSPSPGESSSWTACPLLSEVRLSTTKGTTFLSWAYPPSLRHEILHPSRFAQIRRSTISKFRTHAGLALYEICARYKDNPSHLTSSKHWHWWLPVLTGKPIPAELKTEWRFFHRDTLKGAIEEVNNISELEIKLIEKKVGRSVEFIQFFVMKKKEEDPKTAPVPIDVTTMLRAYELGVEREVAEELFERYGQEHFAKGVHRLEQILALPNHTIYHPTAWIKAVLAGKSLADRPEALDRVQSSAVGQPKQSAAEANQTKFHSLEAQRTKLVRSEIAKIAEDPQALGKLLDGFKKHMEAKNASQPVMARIARAEWDSPVLAGELFVYYWKQTRKTDEWTGADTSLPIVNPVIQGKLF